ncbi:MAG: 50S ribosomal protein L18e [Conexivisphaerales archaeon]
MLNRYQIIDSLSKLSRESQVWKVVFEIAKSSRKRMAVVNVGKIELLSKEGMPILVPGKVLGAGRLRKKVIVGAFDFSATARKKIISAGGEALYIEEFATRYRHGSGVLFVGG